MVYFQRKAFTCFTTKEDNMKTLRKLVVSFVAMCMAVILPASLSTKPVAAATEAKISVYSIDAGRKYFSEDQLKQLIDYAKETGFTHVQLILGNDGLRFIMDEMAIEANGKTYASDDVKNAIIEGTKEYYDDPNGTVLTEEEMDAVLAYAKKQHIGIIPAINSPGHMDAILNTMRTLGIDTPEFIYQGTASKTTVDMANQEAIEFTKALVEKYALYFSDSVEYFNFGADEYANDATYHGPSEKSGYLVLQELGLYDNFITYINEMADMIKGNGMIPVCFNDGIYYNQDDQNGEIDTDIVVAMWTPGFDRYTPASAQYLSDKGFKLINTNDNWYYVIGRDGNRSGWWYGTDMAERSIKSIKFNQLPGTNADNQIPTIGSMVCTWADEPQRAYKPEIVKGLMELFAENNPDYVFVRANYEVVDKALETIPSDLSIYTDESIAALNSAIEKVVYNLKADQQEAVDAMAKAIVDAVAALEELPVEPETKPEVKPTPDPKPEVKPEVKPDQTIKPEENPGTGDSSNLYLFATALIASLGFMGYAFKKRMN